ncbi:hypothetical protein D9M68_202230 [compost metagenome]
MFGRVEAALPATDDPGRHLGGDGGRHDPADAADHRVGALQQGQQLFHRQLAGMEADVRRRQRVQRPFLARLQVRHRHHQVPAAPHLGGGLGDVLRERVARVGAPLRAHRGWADQHIAAGHRRRAEVRQVELARLAAKRLAQTLDDGELTVVNAHLAGALRAVPIVVALHVAKLGAQLRCWSDALNWQVFQQLRPGRFDVAVREFLQKCSAENRVAQPLH